jgi:glutamine amidotransferase-like uncharacterized protein
VTTTNSGGKLSADTTVVVYGDTAGGVTSQTVAWVTHFLDWWQTYDNSIKYVVLSANDLKSSQNVLSNYPNIRLYFQPGGNAFTQQLALGSTGKANINGYIDSGKTFVGICAGFYYATSSYWWNNYGNWNLYQYPNLLGKYPTTVEGSISSIQYYYSDPVNTSYTVTTMSNGNRMIYWGGPTIGYLKTAPSYSGQSLLQFSNGIPTNLPAAIKYNNLLLTSVHPEAYNDGRVSPDARVNLTTAEVTANYVWFSRMINSVAGNSFTTP